MKKEFFGENPTNIENKPRNKDKDEKLVFRAGVSPVESNKKIGPIRSYLYNYAFAKGEAEKGKDSKIIFSIDDTNKEKHTKEKGEEIFHFFTDILGFKFDITPHNAKKEIGQSVFQSERQDIYQGYLEKLFDKHIAFVDRKSGLVLFDIRKFIDQYTDTLEIEDLLKGKLKLKLEENLKRGQNFFPLLRSDKSALYHLASVVDDSTFGVTHVVRGQDKFSIVQFQEMVRVSLGIEPKKYLHTPMLLEPRSKSFDGKLMFNDFIKKGIMPHALISYMISSGYGNPDETYPSLEEFIGVFDYRKIHKSSGLFDTKKLENINNRIIKKTSPEVYLNSFLIYLSGTGEKELLERIKIDSTLQNIIITLRRSSEETLVILKSILEPQYEAINEDIRSVTQKVFLELKKDIDVFPSAEVVGLDKKTLYDIMRWILVGRYSFPNITQIFQYLKDNNVLNERVESAEIVFMKNFS
jgi:glutamyl/glutaminyl-tRNA synthetase